MCFLSFHTAQAQASDSFDDGDFTQNPAWQGDAAFFTVANGRLQSNGPAATSVIHLSTPVTLLDSTIWEFSVNLMFAPSNSNYARIYLVSDQADLKGNLNGYFVRIGENGTTDGVDLFLQQGALTTARRIIDGADRRAATNPVALRIRIIRNRAGVWQLFSKRESGTVSETDFVKEGETVIENTLPLTAGHFGVVCNFTSTNRQRFAFDDFIITDGLPPLLPIGYRELIISELLADESPRVELPPVEFVELHNPTERAINLRGCILSDPTTRAVLPNFSIRPGEYVILCRTANVTDFEPYGRTLGIANFPSLNNAGDELTLHNAAGQTVDQVRYTDQWYADAAKAEGGWSLEQIDLANPCGEEGNWRASEADEGGTPGKANSVAASKPDFTPPVLLTAEVVSPTQISLAFDEKLDSLAAADARNFRLEPAVAVAAASPEKPGLRNVILSLSTPLAARTVYTLNVLGLKDCNQNLVANAQTTALALPEAADSSDVIISEVLFNPRVGGVDFVEVYNRSDKFVNLKDWQLANVENDGIANQKTVTKANRILPPKTYVAFTTDAKILTAHYPKTKATNIVVVPTMPTYYDEAGTVVLLDNRNRVIDRLDYSEDWHFAMLQDKEGVSLERLDMKMATHAPDNWHSAAATEGYATPGYANSQILKKTPETATFEITPRLITPNEDGHQDFAALHYRMGSLGYIATVQVFDVVGRPIRQIAANQSLAAEGFFTWDGTSQSGERVRSGRYIVAFSVFNPNGNRQVFKEDVVVSW